MKKLLDILLDIRSDIDFINEKNLIEDGYLDSVDILTIVSAINSNFNINIPIDSIIPENFNSLDAIQNMIDNLKK